MDGMSDLMGCWEDLWTSCATLLKDLSEEEQAKAAYQVLNNACISAFLPSSSPEPPSPTPTAKPVSPSKQTNKQITKKMAAPNKQKDTRGAAEVKKESALDSSKARRRQVLVKRVAAKPKASRATSMSTYKGMKLRVKQEPKDPLSVNQTKPQQKSILKRRIEPKRANVNIKRERFEDSGTQNPRKSGSTKLNIKQEFAINGRKPKRRFRCYNDVQRSELNRTFDISAYPSTQERRRLEGELRLTKAQVQTWFANKRLTKGIKKGLGGREVPATLSSEQLDQLTTSFTVNSFPSKQDRLEISALVGMTEAQLVAWFTSQRTVEGVRKAVKIQLVDLEKAVRMGKKQTMQLEEALKEGDGDLDKVKKIGKELGLRSRQISSWLKKRSRG